MILTRPRAAKQVADIAPLKLCLPRPGLAPFINSLIEYLSTYLPYEFFSYARSSLSSSNSKNLSWFPNNVGTAEDFISLFLLDTTGDTSDLAALLMPYNG